MKFDVAILGAGPGGYVAALRSAKKGASVAVVEENRIGGTCLNRGCIPTKVMIESAHRFSIARDSGDYGISSEGVVFNYQTMIAKRDEIVNKLVEGIEKLFEAQKITLIKGYGRPKTPRVIDVEGYGEVSARNIILATGSGATSLPGLNIDGRTVLDSDQVLQLKELPESVIIVGAGAVGCEFAYFYSCLGVRVELVEIMKSILPAEEKRLTTVLQKHLKDKGVNVYLGTTVEEIKETENGVKVSLSGGGEVNGDFIFLSVGRRPRLDAFKEMDKLEIDNGRVVADFGMRTSLDGVYAIGDIVNSPMLAHVASEEAEVAVANIFDENSSVDYSSIPSVVYTYPELARVGPTEDELKERGEIYKTVVFNFYSNGRALGMNAGDGVVKMIGDGDGLLIGCSILSPSASEMIGEVALAIKQRITLKDLGDMVHNHPSLSETIGEAYKEFTIGAVHRV